MKADSGRGGLENKKHQQKPEPLLKLLPKAELEIGDPRHIDAVTGAALSCYFGTVHAHQAVPPSSSPNTAYCYVLEPIRCVYGTVVELHQPSLSAGFLSADTFFSDGNRWLGPIFSSQSSSVLIRVNGIEVGVYTPGRHTLVATDWVHGREAEIVRLIHEIAGALAWKRPEEPVEVKPPKPKRRRVPQHTLGADPEFEVYDQRSNSIVSADNVWNTFWRRRDSLKTAIGLDGAGVQIEVRPQPTPSPERLYKRIRTLCTSFEERTRYKLALSGHTYPLGCHIHLGGPTGWGVHPNEIGEFVSRFDRAIGDLACLSGQARGSYAERQQYQTNEHGFEYRTLPSAVLALPELAIELFWGAVQIADGQDFKLSERASALAADIKEVVRTGAIFTWGLEILKPPTQDALSCSPYFSSSDDFNPVVIRWLEGMPWLRSVEFFGYRSSRGNVSNLPTTDEAWSVVTTDTPLLTSYQPRIGLPWDFRLTSQPWADARYLPIRRALVNLCYISY